LLPPHRSDLVGTADSNDLKSNLGLFIDLSSQFRGGNDNAYTYPVDPITGSTGTVRFFV